MGQESKFEFTDEQKRMAMDIASPDRIITQNIGFPVRLKTEVCLICCTDRLVTKEQEYFEGPQWNWWKFSETPKEQVAEYIKTKKYRICENCGIDPEKIHPDVLDKIQN
jgi:hypothetical protein